MRRLLERIARLQRRALVLSGHFASVVALAGCSGASHVSAAAEQAGRDFSKEVYCPLARVNAVDMQEMPAPSAEVANDPERLAMWQAAARRRAETDPRHTVAVRGCGERMDYICWDIVSHDRGRRGQIWTTKGAVCIEEAR
jgi:hypothetical protein